MDSMEKADREEAAWAEDRYQWEQEWEATEGLAADMAEMERYNLTPAGLATCRDIIANRGWQKLDLIFIMDGTVIAGTHTGQIAKHAAAIARVPLPEGLDLSTMRKTREAIATLAGLPLSKVHFYFRREIVRYS